MRKWGVTIPRLWLLLSLLLSGAPTGDAAAAQVAEIELNDGSVLRGEIASFNGGVYSLKSESLGNIHIEESKIKSIHMGAGATLAPVHSPARLPAGGEQGASVQGAPSGEQIKTLGEHIMGDKALMGTINSLADDPEVRNILKDPEIMHSVESGDVSTLLQNPKFQKFLSKPEVQDITKRALR